MGNLCGLVSLSSLQMAMCDGVDYGTHLLRNSSSTLCTSSTNSRF